MEEPQVILVDESDRETGTMGKLEAHEKGTLHRAFSVFVLNSSGELLLQQRAAGKYHSAGLWTNACCSHPSPGEDTLEAAKRRLQEEMGFSCELKEISTLLYYTKFSNGLAEHEFDHLFIGRYDLAVHPDPAEVSDFKFISFEGIDKLLQEDPGAFSYWFRLAYPLLKEYLRVNSSAVSVG